MTQPLYRPNVSGLRSCARVFVGYTLKTCPMEHSIAFPTIVLMPHARFCLSMDFMEGLTRNSCASSASRLGPHQEDPDAGLENIQGVPFDAAYGVQADIEAESDGFEQHHVQPATVV